MSEAWDTLALGQQAMVLFGFFAVGMGALIFIAWWFFCPPLTEEDLLE